MTDEIPAFGSKGYYDGITFRDCLVIETSSLSRNKGKLVLRRVFYDREGHAKNVGNNDLEQRVRPDTYKEALARLSHIDAKINQIVTTGDSIAPLEAN